MPLRQRTNVPVTSPRLPAAAHAVRPALGVWSRGTQSRVIDCVAARATADGGDLIISGEFNVSPVEVELVLQQLLRVLAAAEVGVPLRR